MTSPTSFFRRNGLSLTFGAVTLLCLLGHLLTGYATEQSDRMEHAAPPIDLLAYLGSPAFLSSLFENLESEFLQMGLFVLLTVGLRQKGSSESNPLVPAQAKQWDQARAPWPVRRGGIWLRLYEHSLSAALLILFLISFIAHSVTSHTFHQEDALRHGSGLDGGFLAHVSNSQFWFESFQNWQSEFFSITVLVVLTIYLREKGSAQSKDVDAPHSATGT